MDESRPSRVPLERPNLERPSLEPPQRKSGGSLIPIVTVLGTLLLLALGVVMVAGPAGLYMLIAVAALAALPVLHYLTWGWWLSRSVEKERQAERDKERAER